MVFDDLTIKHLFPTPLVIASLRSATLASLNAELTHIVLGREANSTGAFVSNKGGWQSDDQILTWGGEPVKSIVTALTALLGDITVQMEGLEFRRAPINWQVQGWANVNRRGDANVPHVHPGAYWSAVYYVLIDESDPAHPKGGDLELLDPRGAVPLLYCPRLRFGIRGYVSAGTSEIHPPKAGQCVIFPSWLMHAVRPYIGEKSRISLAFNFSVGP